MCVPTGDLGKTCRHRKDARDRNSRAGEGEEKGNGERKNKKKGRGSRKITSNFILSCFLSKGF